MIPTRTSQTNALHLAGALVIALSTLIPVAASAQGEGDSIGPDVVVFSLPDTYQWGSSGDLTAYSVGTTSCNRGTEPVYWISSTNQHPVIAQNLYRHKEGRLEQVGISWLKHGFVSVNGNSCGTCQYPPMGGSQLGVGCSDPYSASLNGSQSLLGPRFEVNPYTGVYVYPETNPTGTPVLAGRLQVVTDDVTPASNPGARYFIEGQYIASDDAQAGNGLNNASYREVTIGSGLGLNVVGSTYEGLPAIVAWQTIDPSVNLTAVDVPGEGRFHLAYTAVDNGNGTWRYEFALHNLNSDRAARSFTVQVPFGSAVGNVGFHDIFYHSGEPYDGTDWVSTVDPGASTITWSTVDYATDPDANALRWATMYNFWFDADVPPQEVIATVGLFKPGTPSSVQVALFGTGLIMADDFETGDLSGWSANEP